MTYREYNKLIEKKAKQIHREREEVDTTELWERWLTAKKNNNAEEEQRAKKELDAVRESTEKERLKNIRLKFEIYAMQNNAFALLYEEILPPIITYLKSIAGKSYGKVTANNLYAFFKDKYNYAVTVFKSDIYVTVLNEKGFSTYVQLKIHSTYGNDILTDDNKVNESALTTENFRTYDCKSFINDIPGYIRDMKKQYDKAKKLIDEYNAIKKEYDTKQIKNFPSLPWVNL